MPQGLLRTLFVGLICCICMVFAQYSFAQDAESSPDTIEIVDTESAVEPDLKNTTTAPIADKEMDLSQVDLQDPDLQNALKAREEAERAVIEAIVKQQRNADTPSLDSSTDVAAPKAAMSPDILKAKGAEVLDKVIGWLKSPKFLAQVGAVLFAFFVSPLLAKQLQKRIFFFRDPPAEGAKLKMVRDYVYRSRSFLRAVMLVLLLAISAVVLKAIPAFGEDWLVKLCQGIAVVFLIYKAIKEFVSNDLFRKLATYTAIPLALLAVFGYFDDFIGLLEGTTIVPMGETPITVMTLVRLAIFGGLFFWLGNLSNRKGQDAIRSQEGLDGSTQEVVGKLFQMILFVITVVLVMSFAGIPLSGLVMIMSAIGLGIGLGLQPVAANFVSGIIILFDRSVRKGDFIVLPEGQEGYVEAINMRSTTIETTDGKDIMVPNTTFIENTYENWTHTDPAQRYEVYFGVAYDTDIDKLEEILIPAIAAYPKVLMKPEEPDLELREFGEFSIKFAIEFWVSGIDDGENKFTSDLNYIVWRTLKDNGITMPLPQREVRNLK